MMRTATEETAQGDIKTISRNRVPEGTGKEAERGIDTRDDMKTVMNIAHHTNQDGQETTETAAAEVTTIGKRRRMINRIIEVEEDGGLTPHHRLDHGRDHLAARHTANATDCARLNAHLDAHLDAHHAVPRHREGADDGQTPRHLTRTPLKPLSALSHLHPNPLSAHAAEVLSKPTS